jgi:hypothetical protein
MPSGFGLRRSALAAAPEVAQAEVNPKPVQAAPVVAMLVYARNPTVGVRYYNPVTGRYVSRDLKGYPNGLNNDLYVNNPIN